MNIYFCNQVSVNLCLNKRFYPSQARCDSKICAKKKKVHDWTLTCRENQAAPRKPSAICCSRICAALPPFFPCSPPHRGSARKTARIRTHLFHYLFRLSSAYKERERWDAVTSLLPPSLRAETHDSCASPPHPVRRGAPLCPIMVAAFILLVGQLIRRMPRRDMGVVSGKL